MPSLQHKRALPATKEEVAGAFISFDAKADLLIPAMFHQRSFLLVYPGVIWSQHFPIRGKP
ncbi:hypothetical protein Pla110_45160 [Polystyrenella longa]|uniref:Uncharacterized protein n=2 Tax=Polystyrenella longa TaxID=2528007 RepID=A0A518CU86_9PLAN|nr:hypothetical protein Pla110_45160 [Polystyrenella longa]